MSQWIFFDCFNTLLDEADGLTGESGMAPISHVPVEHGLFSSEQAFQTAYLNWRSTAFPGPEFAEIHLKERLLNVLGLQHRHVADTMCDLFSERYPDTLSVTAGVSEMLRRLAGDYRFAVVSNFFAPDFPRELLARFGLLDNFEFVVNSAELGYKKPDVRIYAHALELAGASPADVVFVGDNLKNDVRAPLQAGMQAAWFDRHHVDAPADIHSFRSWDRFDPADIVR